jgi:cation transport ATPase
MTTTLNLNGMHCAACVRRLTDAFTSVPGVRSAHVTLVPPEAHLETNAAVTIDALDAAARSAGAYSVVRGEPSATPQPSSAAAPDTPEKKPSVYPLLLIVGFIAGVTALATYVRGGGDARAWMLDFMAGFFLVFSFFKLLDLRGFADAYQSYDIIARRSRPYAFAYPFLELAIGAAYLTRWQPTLINATTLALMLVGSIGVLKAVLSKRAIRCACLGTALNLPMTTLTLVEDLGMAAMAAAALAWAH